MDFSEIFNKNKDKIFYNPLLGDVYVSLDSFGPRKYHMKSARYTGLEGPISAEGRDMDGNLAIFPSKKQRDWNKWLEEQKPKGPKTWNELNHYPKYDNDDYSVDITGHLGNGITKRNTPIEKSALALLKIHQLIEVGYGGYPTKEDYDKANYERLWTVRIYKTDDNDFIFGATPLDGECFKNNIAFHTIEQTNEFISYPENIQLLKDYFMIQY